MNKREPTPKEQVLLEAVPTDRWASASWIAVKAWGKKEGPWSKRSGQWQVAGRILYRLYGMGLVSKRISDTNQNQWRRR